MTTEERIARLEQELSELKVEYYRNNFTQQQTFIKDILFKGKVGFFSKTPTSQASAIAAPGTPSGVYVYAEQQAQVDAINAIRTVLQNLGFTA
jgi:hypothetical protein